MDILTGFDYDCCKAETERRERSKERKKREDRGSLIGMEWMDWIDDKSRGVRDEYVTRKREGDDDGWMPFRKK